MPITNILKTNKKSATVNVLSFACHERYQTNLSAIPNVNWYLINGGGHVKEWDDTYAKLPPNHFILHNNTLPPSVDIDLILCQNKAAHYGISRQFQQKYQAPLWHLEHCLPPPGCKPEYFIQYKRADCQKHIFISDYSRKAWGYNEENAEVVEHGVDTNLFSPLDEIDKKWGAIVVCNDYINRRWCCGFDIFQQITGFPEQRLIDYKVIGNTPDLSLPAKDTDELVRCYRSSKYFLNTSTVSPIPMSVLEGMSCGLPVVSTNNCMLPLIIQHGENGFLSNSPDELRQYCLLLEKNDDIRIKMGKSARQTIINKYSLGRFVKSWERVLANVHI